MIRLLTVNNIRMISSTPLMMNTWFQAEERDAKEAKPLNGVGGNHWQGPTEHNGKPAPFLLLVEGPESGELLRIDGDDFVMGRDIKSAVPLTHRGISRLHARIFPNGGEAMLEDLKSKNGTLHNHKMIAEPTKLEHGDLINLGGAALFRFIVDSEAASVYALRMQVATSRDPETHTMTVNEFDARARAELSFHKKYDQPLAYVAAEIDEASTSLSPGADLGILRETARRFCLAMGQRERVCRAGEKRFAFLCRQTNHEDGIELAERLRKLIGEQPFKIGAKELKITMSFGVASLPPHSVNLEALKTFAQASLDQARSDGGNRVSCSG